MIVKEGENVNEKYSLLTTIFNGAIKKLIIFITIILLLFSLIGFITTVKPTYRLSSSMLSHWTSHFDESLFLLLFNLEHKSFAQFNEHHVAVPSLSSELFKLMTSIRISDMTSLLGREIPGFSTYEHKIIIAGQGMEDNHISHESSPPLDDILKQREAVNDDKADEVKETAEDQLTTGDREVVFLYNTHNRESFLPHLPDVTNPNEAHHHEVNIKKVSERLKESLEANGIGTSIDDTDIMQKLKDKGLTYGKSYSASRPVVEEALQQNEHIQYLFDIHRDSLPKDKTTIEIDDEQYAKVLFVIGAENASYEKNLKLATDLHYLIEEEYPGLSKGVITKEGAGTNGVFNQDLSENALLIEVGGYENHLDELYRTIDVVADLFAQYYWDAEKVHSD